MKKQIIMIMLFTVFLMTACAGNPSQENDASPTVSSRVTDDGIFYEEGIFFNKEWKNIAGAYEGNVVPNKECAIEIATSILMAPRNGKTLNDYQLSSVFYDTADALWIVTFAKNTNPAEDPGGVTVGDCCSVALQKEDGKVVKIWYGE